MLSRSVRRKLEDAIEDRKIERSEVGGRVGWRAGCTGAQVGPRWGLVRAQVTPRTWDPLWWLTVCGWWWVPCTSGGWGCRAPTHVISCCAACPCGPCALTSITPLVLLPLQVDQRLVRALADMPAHLGEEAVSRYARSIDAHVRNRQGFMVCASCPPACLPACLPACCAGHGGSAGVLANYAAEPLLCCARLSRVGRWAS